MFVPVYKLSSSFLMSREILKICNHTWVGIANFFLHWLPTGFHPLLVQKDPPPPPISTILAGSSLELDIIFPSYP